MIVSELDRIILKINHLLENNRKKVQTRCKLLFVVSVVVAGGRQSSPSLQRDKRTESSHQRTEREVARRACSQTDTATAPATNTIDLQ